MLGKKMSRVFACLLCAALVLCLCACKEDAKASSGTTETPTTSGTSTVTDPEPTGMEITAENLVGTWISVRGGDEHSPMPENELYTITLYFREDGNYESYDYDYFYWPNGDGVWEWALGGRGYMGLYGIYRVADGKVVISQMYDDFSDYGDDTMTYQILYLDENKLVVDDSWGTYIRMEDFSEEKLEELCNAVGVEYAPKVYEDWE